MEHECQYCGKTENVKEYIIAGDVEHPVYVCDDCYEEVKPKMDEMDNYPPTS